MDNFRLFLLKLLIFLIPYQAWQPFGSIYVNATFLSFFLYLFVAIINFQQNFRLKYSKFFLIPIGILWSLMLIMTVLNDFPEAKNTFSYVRQMLMEIVFFWLLINEIHKRPYLEIKLLKTFVLSMALMATLYILNIGVEIYGGRKTMFNYNSNMLAMWFVLAIFIILRLLVEKREYNFTKLVYLIFLPLFIVIIAYTGSRGAFVALMLGPFVYLFLFPNYIKKQRILKIFTGLLSILLIGYLIYNTDIMKERIDSQMDDPTFGGRKVIWDNTMETIIEHPWLGQGASGYEKNMISKMGTAWSPHNEYMSVLAYTGIIGFFFFILTIWRLGKSAFSWRVQIGTPYYIALQVVFITFFYVSGAYIASFVLWFFWGLMASRINTNKK